MVMLTGKYKDEEIESVPSSYLLYIIENWDSDNIVMEEVEEEYWWRDKHKKHFEK